MNILQKKKTKNQKFMRNVVNITCSTIKWPETRLNFSNKKILSALILHLISMSMFFSDSFSRSKEIEHVLYYSKKK